jgi:hypothetical protein
VAPDVPKRQQATLRLRESALDTAQAVKEREVKACERHGIRFVDDEVLVTHGFVGYLTLKSLLRAWDADTVAAVPARRFIDRRQMPTVVQNGLFRPMQDRIRKGFEPLEARTLSVSRLSALRTRLDCALAECHASTA